MELYLEEIIQLAAKLFNIIITNLDQYTSVLPTRHGHNTNLHDEVVHSEASALRLNLEVLFRRHDLIDARHENIKQ